ncbi:MAG TPA: YkgJ family cysteine cluster protein [Thermoanaerobaculia bacterium]|nr:YkgJ family cysteine cluster protein [Thermoanaerobaculia bacterium]
MVNVLHSEVDTRAAALAEVHAERLVCRRGCFGCCVDGITVFEVEADRIRDGASELLASGVPHSSGRCAFLGAEGECRIYEHRPYVCRTQGLPLRWLEEAAEAEYRDICSLNDEGTPIEELAAEECWTLGEVEEQLARLNGGRGRVGLRELFGSRPLLSS